MAEGSFCIDVLPFPKSQANLALGVIPEDVLEKRTCSGEQLANLSMTKPALTCPSPRLAVVSKSKTNRNLTQKKSLVSGVSQMDGYGKLSQHSSQIRKRSRFKSVNIQRN